MIIGGSKVRVIENIKKAVKDGDLNRKVEENDAVMTADEELALIDNFFAAKDKKAYKIKRAAMQKMASVQQKAYNPLIKIEGVEKLANLKSSGAGFIVTSNHFNPLDNLCIKKLIKEQFNDDPYIVIQATNLAAPGVIGELFNHLNHIPITKSPSYIRGRFKDEMSRVLDDGHAVLIYPEEEMWFNYRKPRPSKRGAFYFAAELNVSVVPCFVEILDTTKPDNDEFFESKYIVHVLEPIYPDASQSVRANSIAMAERDYALKKAAYEKAYGKKLEYAFEESDIANFRS